MDTLKEMFEETLKDVYFAENAIIKALPKMAEKAQSEELKTAFEEHLEETKGQVGRLDKIFKMLGSWCRRPKSSWTRPKPRRARCRSHRLRASRRALRDGPLRHSQSLG